MEEFDQDFDYQFVEDRHNPHILMCCESHAKGYLTALYYYNISHGEQEILSIYGFVTDITKSGLVFTYFNMTNPKDEVNTDLIVTKTSFLFSEIAGITAPYYNAEDKLIPKIEEFIRNYDKTDLTAFPETDTSHIAKFSIVHDYALTRESNLISYDDELKENVSEINDKNEAVAKAMREKVFTDGDFDAEAFLDLLNDDSYQIDEVLIKKDRLFELIEYCEDQFLEDYLSNEDDENLDEGLRILEEMEQELWNKEKVEQTPEQKELNQKLENAIWAGNHKTDSNLEYQLGLPNFDKEEIMVVPIIKKENFIQKIINRVRGLLK